MQFEFIKDGDTIFTASTDKTVGVFDTMTGRHYLWQNSCFIFILLGRIIIDDLNFENFYHLKF